MAPTATTPMRSPLERVSRLGQSVLIDWLSRDLLSSGGVQRLIADHAVTGATTNPTILERAIAARSAYDSQIADLLGFDLSPGEITTELPRADVSEAARQLLPVWQESRGAEGYGSWEVDLKLARSPGATLAAVRQLGELVELPRDVERAVRNLGDLVVAGLDLERLTTELEHDGIRQFGRSLDALETRIGSLQQQPAKAA